MMNNAEIGKAMVIKLDSVLPEYPQFLWQHVCPRKSEQRQILPTSS